MAAGAFDPLAIIAALDGRDVDYVIIGGVAARLHGSPALTEDLDATPERSPDNLARLANALADLNARLAAPGVPEGLALPLDADTFSSPVMTFTTTAGAIDIVLDPPPGGGFEVLRQNAVRFVVGDIEVLAASLDDIITSKRASGRPKDLAHLQLLEQLKSEVEP